MNLPAEGPEAGVNAPTPAGGTADPSAPVRGAMERLSEQVSAIRNLRLPPHTIPAIGNMLERKRRGEVEAEALLGAPEMDERTLTAYLEANPPSAWAIATLIGKAKIARDHERQTEVAGMRYSVARAAKQWTQRRFAADQAAGDTRTKTKWAEAITPDLQAAFPALKNVPDARRIAEHWLRKTPEKK